MKKLLIPAALLLSCFFIGCATTEKTVDTNKTSYEAEKNPGVETEKKSESTGTKEKAPETKPAETKPAEKAAKASAGEPVQQAAYGGELLLFDVDEKTAACLMAIVCEQTKIPLNELVFKSIRALD